MKAKEFPRDEDWKYALGKLHGSVLDELSEKLRFGLKNDSCIDEVAEIMKCYFGFSNFVVDTNIIPEDKKIFWVLEGAGLLSTLCEEHKIPLECNRIWKVYYWAFNWNYYLGKRKQDEIANKNLFDVYQDGLFEKAFAEASENGKVLF